jgi:exodeoxyribonuclease VII small subunit
MAEKTKASKKEEESDFEEALGALEEIVGAMESDRMPLAELLTSYEKGTRLLKVCQTRIDEAQAKIELIARRAEGDEVSLTEFEAGAAQEESAPAKAKAGTSAKRASDGKGDEIELL